MAPSQVDRRGRMLTPACRLATPRARKHVLRLAGLFATGLAGSLAAVAQSAEPLRLTQTIPLPEVSGRLDHLAIDLKVHRLFVGALENNTGEGIDLKASKWVRKAAGCIKPTGTFYAPVHRKLLF